MAIKFIDTPIGRVASTLLSTKFEGVERILQDYPIEHQILEEGIVTASPVNLQAIVSELGMTPLPLKEFCTLTDWLKTREGQTNAPSLYSSLFRKDDEDLHFGVLAEHVVPRISTQRRIYYGMPREFKYANRRWGTDYSVEQMQSIPFPPKGALNKKISTQTLPFNTKNIGTSGLPESSNPEAANPFKLDCQLDGRETTAITHCIYSPSRPIKIDTIFGLDSDVNYPYFTILPKLTDSKH